MAERANKLRGEREKTPRTMVQFSLREQDLMRLRQLSELRDIPATHLVRSAVVRMLKEADL